MQDTTFAHIKRLPMSAQVLKCADYEREFVVYVDASEMGVGAFQSTWSSNDERSLFDEEGEFTGNGAGRQRRWC